MYSFKTLEETEIEILNSAFIEAFSDYQVKVYLPLWKFKNMLQRRGYLAQISIGAFENDELVGFILNGLGIWNGKSTAYDTGTGVISRCREQGLTKKMIQDICEILKERNVEQYLLEVIQTNAAAFQLYKKQGFEITREFLCFHMMKSNYKAFSNYKVTHLDKFDSNHWGYIKNFWDVEPSWQNSINSINSVEDSFTYSVVMEDNKIIGYGIIDKRTGDIPQIAVSKVHRGKGVGRSIMTDLVNNTESGKVGIINIDSSCEAMGEFLLKLGFQHGIDQYEMILQL